MDANVHQEVSDQSLGGGELGITQPQCRLGDRIEHLRKVGWNAAEHWLEANLRFVGDRSTVDLSGLLPLQDGLFKDPIGIRQRLQTLDQIIRGITH